MKTEINAESVIGEFFGFATLRSVTDPANTAERLRYAKALRDELESTYSNVETRIAFVWMYGFAQYGEKAALCKAMGISIRTLRHWINDAKAYQEGTLKLRTLVIRKSV